MNKRYDILLIGTGLFNAIIAREAALDGFNCLAVEKKKHLGGCLFCENKEGINIHKYGPHIFHTSDKKVWDYMNEYPEKWNTSKEPYYPINTNDNDGALYKWLTL